MEGGVTAAGEEHLLQLDSPSGMSHGKWGKKLFPHIERVWRTNSGRGLSDEATRNRFVM
jgi:hypothetical protein